MAKYPMVTPYYASLIRSADSSDPIFQMCVPQADELIDPPFLTPDPLEECRDMPVPGMVHRYPDRALVIATTMCSTYCRHCTRKRIAGTRETSITKRRLEQIAAYLREHLQISDGRLGRRPADDEHRAPGDGVVESSCRAVGPDHPDRQPRARRVADAHHRRAVPDDS